MDTASLLSLPFLQDDLARLEPELRDAVSSGDQFLDEVTTHLIAAGGKRLRPCLALAAATGGRRAATADDLQGAVAVELVHLASLYHDDVMDEALVRRNVESVNARFGNLVAIVAGDFLLARSAEIAASLGTEIAGLLANTLGLLCARARSPRCAPPTAPSAPRPTTCSTIEGKTAALMSTSCRIGAITGGLPRTEVDVLTDFGRCFGMLFQLRDDILDVVATDEELGKPAGQDLAEGIYTLPVLLALRDPDTGPELRPLLGAPLDQPERDKATRHRGGIGRHRRDRRRGPPLRRPSAGRGRCRGRAPRSAAPWRTWPGRCSRGCPSRARVGRSSELGRQRLGAQRGEGDDLADVGHVGQQHDEAVDPDAEPGRGGQAVLEGPEVVLVDGHGLLVAPGARRGLGLEPGPLVLGVDELGEGVPELPSRPRWARSARRDRGRARCRRASGDTSAG